MPLKLHIEVKKMQCELCTNKAKFFDLNLYFKTGVERDLCEKCYQAENQKYFINQKKPERKINVHNR